MKLVTTCNIDPDLWDQFVSRHPLGAIYHHSAWQKAISKTYGYEPLFHLLQDDSSSYLAGISSAYVKSWITGNRIVSYPFSDTCDALVSNPDELDALLAALQRTREQIGASFFELRLAEAQRFCGGNGTHIEYLTHVLPLERKPEELFRSFHKSSIQRAIKKAEREELEIVPGKGLEDLRHFYRLHLLTRKKQGVPIQPFRFFTNLWDCLMPRDMLTLLLARYKSQFIAGIIVLWFDGTAYYKFGASDREVEHLRANQFLMWEAIRRAQARGCTFFDFGRTSVANKGLCLYKRRWGTVEKTLHTIRLPEGKKHGTLDETSKRHVILKRVMTRMPSWVFRLSGELFYRHLA